MDLSAYFSERYAEGRERFLAAATAAPTLERLWSEPFEETDATGAPFVGREGETLAADFAWFGAADAPAVLILSSGVHGAEGLAGAGAQLAAIDAVLPAQAGDALAVLMIHGLNPWGCSHGRRCDHDGIDVMRNHLDFSAPPPEPSPIVRRYAWAMAPAAVFGPARWRADAAILWSVLRYGLARLQADIPMGQYAFPDAPFYGGARPSWSRRVLERHLAEAVGRNRRAVAMIDVHTGLGARGVGVLLGEHESLDDIARRLGADWWGDAYEPEIPADGHARRFARSPARQTAYRLNGSMPRAVRERIFEDPRVVSAVLEFGTVPQLRAFNAVRDDHAAWRAAREAGRPTPDPKAPDVIAARRAMRAAFYPDDAAWRASVAQQTVDAARRAAIGLRAAAANRDG